MKTFSDAYQNVLLQTHATSKGWGTGGKGHRDVVEAYAREIGAVSILDYGCGRGTLKPLLVGFDVSEYDPGIPGKSALPGPVDLVVCTDVLEHIEPEYIGNALLHLRGLSRLGMFAIIALSPAKLTLTDGRNAHLLVKTREWWLNSLMQHGFHVVADECRKGLFVWAK